MYKQSLCSTIIYKNKFKMKLAEINQLTKMLMRT